MENKIRRSLVVGVICLLMLVSIPLVNALDEYPREEGPYKVFMGGKCSIGGNKPLWFDFPGLLNDGKPKWFQLGPLSLHRWPVGPQYQMENGTKKIKNVTEKIVPEPYDLYHQG